MWADPTDHYLSANAHFCISAMRRYSPWDFIDMVNAHGIAFHEKKLGQLFCDHSAQDIVDMLLAEAADAGVTVRLKHEVSRIQPINGGYQLSVSTGKRGQAGQIQALKVPSVVLASGGLSLPKIASDLALRTAESLQMAVVPPCPALVPLTWNNSDQALLAELSGVAIDCEVTSRGQTFRENLLFTHRGLSGPAILQASSYWAEGESLSINLLPDLQLPVWFQEQQRRRPRAQMSTVLKTVLPNRLVDALAGQWFDDLSLADLSTDQRLQLAAQLGQWAFKPGGTEGYRTAEVTLGGISTDEFSSKTFEAKRYPRLFAIGEALDVTGWLGGYNFQWAWASGYCCAQHL
jgi:predicted Rossmann fold flavoprotein